VLALLTAGAMVVSIFSVPALATAATGDEPVRIHQTGDRFDTLAQAVAAADSAGLASATLEVLGDVAEAGTVTITSDVTVVGVGGAHTVTGCSFRVTGGGHLTLGSGAAADPLTVLGSALVNDGAVDINDGVSLENHAASTAATALRLNGPNATGAVRGGRLVGYTALWMEPGSTLSEISGGELVGSSAAAEVSGLSGTSPTIGAITGGVFRKTDDSIDRSAFHLDNGARINLISGGTFNGSGHTGLLVIRGSWVGSITGGEFLSPSGLDMAGLTVYADTGAPTTGVGQISGGRFLGATPTSGAKTGLGLWLYGAGSRVDAITGGLFEGERGMENDVNAVIGTISGGKFNGAAPGTRSAYGVLNVSKIGTITGATEIVGKSAGIWNYYGSQISEISGGTISSSGADITGDGISNAGTIERISGGTVIGNYNAISNTGSNPGHLNVISAGAFWGKLSRAITLSYPMQLEPGLSAPIGVGRYQSGGGGAIFNNDSLVVYPAGYSMSAPTQTLPVTGVAGTEFRYLKLPEPVKHTVTVEDSFAADSGAGSYASGASVTVRAGERDGYVFAGWETADGVVFDDATSATTGFVMPGADVTVTATWDEAPTDPGVPDDPGTPVPEVHTVTVENSYAAESGAGSYAAGAAVTVRAGARDGYVFMGWETADGVLFDDATSATTGFVMPSRDVTVTASWISAADVTVATGPTGGADETSDSRPKADSWAPAGGQLAHTGAGGVWSLLVAILGLLSAGVVALRLGQHRRERRA